MTDDVTFLVGASERERANWIAARHQPGPNYLLGVLAQVRHMIGAENADRRSLASLYLWLVRHGRDIGWSSAFDACLQVAYFISELQARGFADGLQDVLPDADHIVRDCLDLIPITPGDVPQVVDLTRMEIEEMRRSRRAKNLTRAAQYHRDGVCDPHLAIRLRTWIDLLPRLV